jgi:integrase
MFGSVTSNISPPPFLFSETEQMTDRIASRVAVYVISRKGHVSQNYLRDSEAVLGAWVDWLAERNIHEFAQLDLEILQTWASSRIGIVKVSSAASYVFQVRLFLAWAIKNGCELQNNHALSVVLPPHRKPIRKRFVDRKTVGKLIANCEDDELKYCLFCGFHAGLRFGEVVMSRPDWFDLDHKVLHVTRSDEWETKDHSDRTVPLTDNFVSFLAKYGLRYPFMIAPKKLRAVKHRYRFDFSRRFEHYVSNQSVSMTFHDARRTFASLHVQAGTSIYKVARWLGDDVEVVSRHYGHLADFDDEVNRAFRTSAKARLLDKL